MTKKVILATNSEFGQANVFLAVGHALQAADSSVEVHFVSFSPISPYVSEASEYSVASSPGARPWTFHKLDGVTFADAIMGGESGYDSFNCVLSRQPNLINTTRLLFDLNRYIIPWTGPEFVEIMKSFVRIADEIRPDLIMVDSLFAPALTACHHHKLDFLVLSPNTLRDFSSALQPWGALFWKYPMVGTALVFPIPWHHIPLNVFYVFLAIFRSLTDPALYAKRAHIQRETGAGEIVDMNYLTLWQPSGAKILVANRPEIEYPMVFPPHLTPCGPMLRPVRPVSEVDPELETWLRRGPTVFVSLGTLLYLEEHEAAEIAGALQQLLDAVDRLRPDAIAGVPGQLQVLWKLKNFKRTRGKHEYGTGPGTRIHGILQRALDSDRVRIVDWVKPEPGAILQTGTVVCSVNHGGANSFNDAVSSGVPQISLPCWLDCYDFGNRTEILGIGRWGNKKAKPRYTAQELGPILVDVVIGPKADEMRAKVKGLAKLLADKPGADVAAKFILGEIDARKVKM
ncbi:hypothetical protein VTK26DRAFT_6153 [Humicola hyalothermophila]